jgi:hypothetical protein
MSDIPCLSCKNNKQYFLRQYNMEGTRMVHCGDECLVLPRRAVAWINEKWICHWFEEGSGPLEVN